MAYTKRTEHLKLPQWELSDKPDMMDFNRAFFDIDDMAGKVDETFPALKEFAADTGWIPLELLNGATAPTSHLARYRRIGKTVYLQGQIHGVQNDHVIAQLPEGFRPSTGTASCPFICNANADKVVLSIVHIAPSTGHIRVYKDHSQTLVLSSIQFLVD